MKNKVMVALSAIAMVSSLSVASAASPATTSFKVKINIEQGCLFSGTTDLDFGTHAVLTAAINEVSPASVSIACSKDLAYSISFNDGINGGYKMSNGTDTINYTMFSDAGRVDAITAESKIDGIGTGEDVVHNIYGQVTANQGAVSAGEYEDTITVTATY